MMWCARGPELSCLVSRVPFSLSLCNVSPRYANASSLLLPTVSIFATLTCLPQAAAGLTPPKTPKKSTALLMAVPLPLPRTGHARNTITTMRHLREEKQD